MSTLRKPGLYDVHYHGRENESLSGMNVAPPKTYFCDFEGCEGHPNKENYCSFQRRYGVPSMFE